MKRFLTSLATFSLVETIGRRPAIAGGMLLGLVGSGGVGVHLLTTPTITPQVSTYFNQNQNFGPTSNGLQPNNATIAVGSAGPFLQPVTAANSWTVYWEAGTDSNLAVGSQENAFTGLTLYEQAGQPQYAVQRTPAGTPGAQWWNATAPGINVGTTVSGASNYNTGYYPFTATGGGCAREPSGIWNYNGSVNTVQITDPGFGCSTTPTVSAATIPKAGAQQTVITATCASGGLGMLVTTSVPVDPGLSQGLSYALSGFTTSPTNAINTTLIATSITGSGPYAVVGTVAGSCPTISSTGNFGSGTGATFTMPAISTTGPFALGPTGVTTKAGQHACYAMGEYGIDSPFPGAAFFTAVDDKGVALPGAPAQPLWLNMGTTNFQGSTNTTTQSGSSVALTVTSMNSTTLSSPSYNATTGHVSFTAGASNGFVPGSEFTVSGFTSTGASINQTYVTVAGGTGGDPTTNMTTGTTIVGNPLSGPAGSLQAIASPGTISGSGSLVGVIVPGMTILGSTPANSYILPYGTFSSTGTGGAGTYPLSSNQTAAISSGNIFAWASHYYSATATGAGGGTLTAKTTAAISAIIGEIGSKSTLLGNQSGWGGSFGNFAMLYGKFPQLTNGNPDNTALASLCKKTTTVPAFAVANGMTVNSLYRLNDPGIFGDSGDATITGYITNSSGTNATLNVVSTTYGSLGVTPSQATAKLTGVGLPVASPVTIPLTSSAGTIYSITPNTTAALGSLGSPVTFAVGAWNPASSLSSSTFTGGVSGATLTVSALPTASGSATFTGSLSTGFTAKIDNGSGSAGNTLTITLPVNSTGVPAVVGIGTVVSAAPGAATSFTPFTITGIGTGANGLSGTYTYTGSPQLVGTAEAMRGTGVLAGPPLALDVSGTPVGTLAVGMTVTDGGNSLTGNPIIITGGAAPAWTVSGHYYGAISSDANMVGTLSAVVPGEYLLNAGITTPVKVLNYQGACGQTNAYEGGPGCYNLSSSANTVAPGSTIVGTTATDGGAIAPGPALTIRDQGPGVTFPVTNYAAGTGPLWLSGTYDVPTLGGTPSGIQALVSNSANGPPLAGCTPCNWGALTGTISGGAWSGTLAGIPGGGPYYVSVRAANGQAYATLPNSIKVGSVFDLEGLGQVQVLVSTQAGGFVSYFPGLWGVNDIRTPFASNGGFSVGPPVVPGAPFVTGQAISTAGDNLGIKGDGVAIPEGTAAFEKTLSASLGWPTTLSNIVRDGVGPEPMTMAGYTQTQTIGLGNGSLATWCSAASFCSNVSIAGPLYSNNAVQTGATLNGATINGSTGVLTVPVTNGLAQGALEPGMLLSDTTGTIGSTPTLSYCTSGCKASDYSGPQQQQLWVTTYSGSNVAAETMRADPVGGAPWPQFNYANQLGVPATGAGALLIKAGTFSVSVNGTVVCIDTQTFAYNNTSGNCTTVGASGASGWVNYQTGDYQITWSGTPPTGAIIASWTQILSPNFNQGVRDRPEGVDFVGDGSPQSGAISSMFNKTPGGFSGNVFGGCSTDHGFIGAVAAPVYAGYQFGAVGYTQMVSWLYDTRFPSIFPGVSASTPFISFVDWRSEEPSLLTNTGNGQSGYCDAWGLDVATKSTFSGTIASSVLTLSASTTTPMWEGEVLDCVTVNTNCSIGSGGGVYITGLTGGAWGAAGSTYSLAGSPANVASAAAMQNAVYYTGPGATIFAGPVNDVQVQTGGLAGSVGGQAHATNGPFGARRAGARLAADAWCGLNGSATCSDPTLDRTKADAAGCDSSALAAPCFDVGNTYAAAHSGTWTTAGLFTINGGIAANDRPFVVGQVVNCSPACGANLVITSLSVPPTQSTATGAGEVGQTFTFTTKPNTGGSLPPTSSGGTVTAGCFGTGGSNCIDFAFSVNNSGTFGTAAAITNCGSNNLNGNAPSFTIPTGASAKCQSNGIGEVVAGFRIGTQPLTYGALTGSVLDDGIDYVGGGFNQSAAFTCNQVAGKIVQCVKGPLLASGLFSSVGLWPAGSTYASYGSTIGATSRYAALIGYRGGQSFPITNPGSSYTPGVYTSITGTCATLGSGGTLPKFDLTVGSSGSIVNAYPAAVAGALGAGVGSTCTFTLATGGGTGGSVTIPLIGPPGSGTVSEGYGGVGTYNSDTNLMGLLLYDNSGFVGNPLHSFFQDGPGTGYFEPGLPMVPWGGFQGVPISG